MITYIILYIITGGGLRLMFTNEEVLINLLSSNEDIAKTLKGLCDEIRKQESIVYRKKMHGEKNIYKDYNKARDKMIKYLFKLNKKYHFMDYVTVYDYSNLIISIDSFVLSLEIFNLALDSCSLS